MGLRNILRKGFGGAAEVSPALGPAGMIFSAAVKAVLKAEDKHGAGKGAEKKKEAREELASTVPSIIEVTTERGYPLKDPVKLVQGLEELNDSIVKVLNAFEMLGRKNDRSKSVSESEH